MPITLIDTVGGSTSDTYTTTTDADTYFSRRLGATAWTGASVDEKAQALIMAADRFQNENWIGSRASSTQRLAWPRIGAKKVDGVGTFDGYTYSDFYLTDEIPQPVKDAQCEYALFLLANGAAPGANNSRVKSFTADGLTVTREYSNQVGTIPSEVMLLLSGLIVGNEISRG